MSVRFDTILAQTKVTLPDTFTSNVQPLDPKLTAYLNMVLAEINLFPPQTGYTFDGMPTTWDYMIVFGSNIFAMMFLQMDATLKDFTYNDNGLSVQIDHVSKLDIGIKTMLETYKNMVLNAKAHETVKIKGVGIGTPRFQSVIGQFIRISLGNAWPSGVSVAGGMY